MPASGLLLRPRMLRRSIVVLVAGLAACGTHRAPVPPDTPRIAVAPPPAAAVGTRRATGELDCVRNPRIDAWERRLRGDAPLGAATRESLERGERYLPEVRAILARHGLPESLALLPALESGYEPRARGRYGELGLWQLRRPTARRFGLVVDARRDERVVPARSTEAAARYLAYLRARYGEWPLALAAYNAGERRVDRALARRPDATFWELADGGWLPRTSRDFVPRFLAVVRLDRGAERCA
jgi:hypothetical protein